MSRIQARPLIRQIDRPAPRRKLNLPQFTMAQLRATNKLDEGTAQIVSELMTGRQRAWYPSHFVGDVEYIHRATYAAAGSSQFVFFNSPQRLVGDSSNTFVTDLPGNGAGLPSGHCFFFDGISFALNTGVDYNGTTDLDGSTIQQTPAEAYPGTTEAAAKTAEEIRRIFAAPARCDVIVNGYVIDHFVGLWRAPQGGGLHMNMAMAGTTAATHVLFAANITNGMPNYGVRRRVRPQLILPNSPITVELNFPVVRPLTCAGVLECRLHGQIVKPRGQN
ncbi:MAG: hypothetical protein ACKVW3_11770 [Phycisphaerales bacterium]